MKPSLVILPLLLAASTAQAADVRKTYLMAFHSCQGSGDACRDPRNHRVYVAQSNRGRRWKVVPGWEPYEGSVPDVVRRNQHLYVYTPGEVRRYGFENEKWSDPEPFSIVDSEGRKVEAVDPSPVNNDGTLVLFFLEGVHGGDPARCSAGQSSCTKRILSATEVEGSNGGKFVLDEGTRLSVTISAQGDSASDPDIFWDATNERWVLYVSRGMRIDSYTSDKLRGDWESRGSLNDQGTGGVAAGLSVRKKVWTYATFRESPGTSSSEGIGRAVHEGLKGTVSSFKSVKVDVDGSISSPGVCRNDPDGEKGG